MGSFENDTSIITSWPPLYDPMVEDWTHRYFNGGRFFSPPQPETMAATGRNLIDGVVSSLASFLIGGDIFHAPTMDPLKPVFRCIASFFGPENPENVLHGKQRFFLANHFQVWSCFFKGSIGLFGTTFLTLKIINLDK